MTSDEAYEVHKAELVKISFANSFVALKAAFQAGWESREIEKQEETTWRYYP